MLRQLASMAAFAIVAAPLMTTTAQLPAMAGHSQPSHHQDKKCVQVRLDRYEYRGEIKDNHHYWDKVYLDWHVDCYNQDKPPYKVYVKAYYEGGYSYSEEYRGSNSDYTFKIRKPKKYAGQKPRYYEIRIVVDGSQGRYEYYNPRLAF
jgi:hypothetical protein